MGRNSGIKFQSNTLAEELAVADDTIRINTIEPILKMNLLKTKKWSEQEIKHLRVTSSVQELKSYHSHIGGPFNEKLYLRLVSMQCKVSQVSMNNIFFMK